MLRTEKRKIGDVQYESTTLVATKAIGLGTRVLKIILPAIGELGGGIAEIRKAIATGAEPEILGGGLGKAAVALVAQLDKEDAVELICRTAKMPQFQTPDGSTAEEYLWRRIQDGAQIRYGNGMDSGRPVICRLL